MNLGYTLYRNKQETTIKESRQPADEGDSEQF